MSTPHTRRETELTLDERRRHAKSGNLPYGEHRAKPTDSTARVRHNFTGHHRRHRNLGRRTRRHEVDRVPVGHRLGFLSDNGLCYVSGDLQKYLAERGMTHTRGATYHLMMQGKNQRDHRSMKNVVKLENYYALWELERAIAGFVDYYNHHIFHELLGNVTSADMYEGR